MMIIKRIFYWIVAICSPVCLYGQEQSLYPEIATIYDYENPFINPSAVKDTGNYEVGLVNKFRSSSRGKVGLFAMNGGTYWRKTKQTHGLQLIFLSEQEGPYINRNRGYLNYAYALPLSAKSKLLAGVTFGFASTYINASSAVTVNNYLVPDANVGIGYQYGGFKIGATMMQALNNAVLPSISELRQTRYYHFMSSFECHLTTEIKAGIWGFYRCFKDLDNAFNTTLRFSYKEVAGIRLVGHTQRGFSFFTDVSLPGMKTSSQITLGYNTGWGSSAPTLHQSLEIGGSVVFF